jgi:hypothetical protein
MEGVIRDLAKDTHCDGEVERCEVVRGSRLGVFEKRSCDDGMLYKSI